MGATRCASSAHGGTRSRGSSALPTGRDSGMSLTELMVVVALMGFVISAAYALQFVVNKAVTANEPMAQGAAGFGDPMEFMSRIIMQTQSVVTGPTVRLPNGQLFSVPSQVATPPGDYSLAVTTNRGSGDGSWELNYFHIGAGSTDLKWESWSYDAANNLVGAQRRWTMSATVSNLTTSTSTSLPLFTYYSGEDGTTPSTPASRAAGDFHSVRISLAMPSAGASSTRDTRLVSFRN